MIVRDKDKLGKHWSERAKAQVHDFLPTITCGGGATRKRVAILDEGPTGQAGLRHPTLIEGLRAQGFPNDWLDNLEDIPEAIAWALIGNAVAKPISQAIAQHLTLDDAEREAAATRAVFRVEPGQSNHS